MQKAHTYLYYMYLLKKNMGEIFLKADKKKHETPKLVIIKKVVERLNNWTAQNIFSMHTWIGPNATSRTFNQGKTVLMKLIIKTDWSSQYLFYHCSTKLMQHQK